VKGRVHAIIQTDGTLEDIFGSNDVIIIHDQMEEVKKDLSFMGISEEEEGEEGESTVSREHINEILSDEEKENDNRLIEKKEHNTFIDKDMNISVETQLTKNLAKLIYDEAKNDALSRIEQDPPYYSDPER
jgi:lactam utilization protein B